MDNVRIMNTENVTTIRMKYLPWIIVDEENQVLHPELIVHTRIYYLDFKTKLHLDFRKTLGHLFWDRGKGSMNFDTLAFKLP